jgi:cell wall-associated NlpC family hydrolase
MSAEISREQRVKKRDLQPGDLVFFGSRGRRSKPAEIGHVAIYFGSGWLIHASRLGTSLSPLTDWYDTNFAFAARLLSPSPTPSFAGPSPAAASSPISAFAGPSTAASNA